MTDSRENTESQPETRNLNLPDNLKSGEYTILKETILAITEHDSIENLDDQIPLAVTYSVEELGDISERSIPEAAVLDTMPMDISDFPIAQASIIEGVDEESAHIEPEFAVLGTVVVENVEIDSEIGIPVGNGPDNEESWGQSTLDGMVSPIEIASIAEDNEEHGLEISKNYSEDNNESHDTENIQAQIPIIVPDSVEELGNIGEGNLPEAVLIESIDEESPNDKSEDVGFDTIVEKVEIDGEFNIPASNGPNNQESLRYSIINGELSPIEMVPIPEDNEVHSIDGELRPIEIVPIPESDEEYGLETTIDSQESTNSDIGAITTPFDDTTGQKFKNPKGRQRFLNSKVRNKKLEAMMKPKMSGDKKIFWEASDSDTKSVNSGMTPGVSSEKDRYLAGRIGKKKDSTSTRNTEVSRPAGSDLVQERRASFLANSSRSQRRTSDKSSEKKRRRGPKR